MGHGFFPTSDVLIADEKSNSELARLKAGVRRTVRTSSCDDPNR
jgi:hypothetical protein